MSFCENIRSRFLRIFAILISFFFPVFSTNAISINLLQTELPVYGASRLGVAYKNATGIEKYNYELADHLGNVRATITEGISMEPEVLSFADYYPGGMKMPGRYSTPNKPYRFGYQGQYAEKDGETGYNQFEARLWDSRKVRWDILDPAGQYWSPYLGMGNNPVSGVDPDGEWTTGWAGLDRFIGRLPGFVCRETWRTDVVWTGFNLPSLPSITSNAFMSIAAISRAAFTSANHPLKLIPYGKIVSGNATFYNEEQIITANTRLSRSINRVAFKKELEWNVTGLNSINYNIMADDVNYSYSITPDGPSFNSNSNARGSYTINGNSATITTTARPVLGTSGFFVNNNQVNLHRLVKYGGIYREKTLTRPWHHKWLYNTR